MNMKQNQAQAYQKTGSYSGVMYADPHSLITQMFDGAMTRIAQAKGAMERNDIASKGELISHSINIIGSLDACLDYEKGGEVSKNLGQLYEYMIRILAQGNIQNDTAKLDEVIKLILEIKSAWIQVPKILNKDKAG
ncbi:MAG: flagellar export chaperone FliS [Gammaproteobacteria bacterium]|nr:flagellar export chaperone FliS [Gammaproteobacteria bacterium]